jgi:hypothetical protein
MKRSVSRYFRSPQTFAVLFLAFLAIATFLVVLSSQQRQTTKQEAAQINPESLHFVGAFSAGDNPDVAASVGLDSILDYGYNPVAGDSKSTALKAANLKIIDQIPDKYMRQFDSDGNLQALLNNMTTHLKAVQNNSQIIAYWVLDDWSHDGTAKTALQQMNALIHQYTPGKPSICGFSGNSGNYAGKTKNFSPTGCDMVGLYIYPQSDKEYDLPTILPALVSGLKAQGWDIASNPLVGVPLSYGGANGYTVPTASQMEREAKAFCNAGATALIYYDFGTGQNGSNNTTIQQGIKAGIAACKAKWGTSSISAGTSTQPAPTNITPTFVCGGSQNCAGTPSPTIFGGNSNQPTPSDVVPTSSDNSLSGTPEAGGATSQPTLIDTSPSSSPDNSPSTGDEGSLLKQILNMLEKLLELLQKILGGSNSRRHHHHHR